MDFLSPSSSSSYFTAPTSLFSLSSPSAPLSPLPQSSQSPPLSPPSPMIVDSAMESPAQEPRYRPAKVVSREVAGLCHILLDESLHAGALSFITSLVNSGTSHPQRQAIPALVPLPLHIEVASVLLVHPRYTTQASQNERAELASRCISFLRSILSNLGPLNANLGDAFSLTNSGTRSWRRRHGDDTSSDDDDEEYSRLKGIVANQGRLRRCATDFWHIVGWAFNCSVVHRKRWKYWKVWLDYMLDVLDADWNEREAQDLADPAPKDIFKLRRNCMLVKYLSGVKGRSSPLKRVVGSIFVDGGFDDLRAYPEVFTNETLEVKSQNGQKRKREDDFEHKFGDYNDEEADLELDSGTPAPSQEADDGNSIPVPDPWMGGSESMALRQRVLVLLSRVAFFLPDEFIDCATLYNVYCENMKLLPLPAFSLLLSPSSSSQIPTEVYVSLSQYLLQRLLPNAAPRPQTVSGRNSDDLSQEILEKCFLPFAANTSSTDDNAKLSILVESMFRLLLRFARVYHTPCLDAAIEKGILARESKSKNDKRRRETSARKKEEGNDRIWLTASGRRLRSMVSWVEQNTYSDDD